MKFKDFKLHNPFRVSDNYDTPFLFFIVLIVACAYCGIGIFTVIKMLSIESALVSLLGFATARILYAVFTGK